ncbi:hypothetical protein QBC37DRAFT_368159 [Rhypophila decipiens]|uniref:Uncharacterized protein n=1 Tax=Rhypophila decipiens TaxID=261697 RepID=A0AAN7BDB4_9PEZI|nr:hypothetical protein QBC37DRAFT_368159 [Rhypophila decipiens]
MEIAIKLRDFVSRNYAAIAADAAALISGLVFFAELCRAVMDTPAGSLGGLAESEREEKGYVILIIKLTS